MFKISRLFPWRTICSLHVRLNPSPVLVVQSALSIARPVRVLWGVWTWNPRLNYVNFAVRSVFRLNWVESKFTAKYPSHVMKSADLHDSFDYLFKIVLIGDPGVGKTCIVQRFKKGTFVERHGSTIGVDFTMKTLVVDSKKVKVRASFNLFNDQSNCLLKKSGTCSKNMDDLFIFA